ncbi:hypothetical protein AAFF_G00265710 [Aldrovandia affinis]|uniref:Uncharacterized protein n=1 Tax=Aldrovandia affinis TaxID=143900 RepID=A0AAD7W2L1_9TELE|nr:hypothetical protein AAFF_G00265710 [Aldrovandia affinis]
MQKAIRSVCLSWLRPPSRCLWAVILVLNMQSHYTHYPHSGKQGTLRAEWKESALTIRKGAPVPIAQEGRLKVIQTMMMIIIIIIIIIILIIIILIIILSLAA